MKIFLLVTSDADIISEFRSGLSTEYVLLTEESLDKASSLFRTERVDMIAVDINLSPQVEDWIRKYRNIPEILWIGIVPAGLSEDEYDRFYGMFHEVLSRPFSKERLKAVIRKARERQEILSEIKHLKLLSVTQPARSPVSGYPPELFVDSLEKVVSLSRTFSASLDLNKLINLFLDAVTDVVGVSRVSLLLADEDGVYRIKGSRGIRKELAASLILPADSGMVIWLSSRGRILRRDKIDVDIEQKDILVDAFRDMEVLRSIVSIPVMYDGALLCILNLDSKVTGEPYSKTELERIFVLSDYFGRSIQDVYNYHKVCYQKEYIQKILERMGSGVITVNDKEEVIIFNPKAEEILKKKASEVIGHAADFLSPLIAKLVRETIDSQKIYRKRELISEEENLYLEVDSYGLYDISGKSVGAVILIDDISAKKELTREKKKGENLQVLNELVGRMAHELRNPLVSVRTFTQLMKDRYDDIEFKEFFYSTVTGEVEKLNNLIEKLIAFAHPIEYKFETVDLAEILDEALESVINGSEHPEFHTNKNYATGIFKLRADRDQISKAFSYMLQNSYRAMNSGGTMTINIESLPKDDMLKVTIRDTGKGIPPEDIEKVFDPFYTTPEKGVGLGLPLSQKIIEDHKGRVAISSAINQGTTLTVMLPFSEKISWEV